MSGRKDKGKGNRANSDSRKDAKRSGILEACVARAKQERIQNMRYSRSQQNQNGSPLAAGCAMQLDTFGQMLSHDSVESDDDDFNMPLPSSLPLVRSTSHRSGLVKSSPSALLLSSLQQQESKENSIALSGNGALFKSMFPGMNGSASAGADVQPGGLKRVSSDGALYDLAHEKGPRIDSGEATGEQDVDQEECLRLLGGDWDLYTDLMLEIQDQIDDIDNNHAFSGAMEMPSEEGGGYGCGYDEDPGEEDYNGQGLVAMDRDRDGEDSNDGIVVRNRGLSGVEAEIGMQEDGTGYFGLDDEEELICPVCKARYMQMQGPMCQCECGAVVPLLQSVNQGQGSAQLTVSDAKEIIADALDSHSQQCSGGGREGGGMLFEQLQFYNLPADRRTAAFYGVNAPLLAFTCHYCNANECVL